MTATTTEFVAEHGITLASSTELGPRTEDGHEFWRHSVQLAHNGQTLTTEYGFGNPDGRPVVDEVLDALVSDGWGAHAAGDFDTWASDYGLDTDSRRALAIYENCVKGWTQLTEFLGEALACDLAENYERL